MSDQQTSPEPESPDTPRRCGGRRPSTGSALDVVQRWHAAASELTVKCQWLARMPKLNRKASLQIVCFINSKGRVQYNAILNALEGCYLDDYDADEDAKPSSSPLSAAVKCLKNHARKLRVSSQEADDYESEQMDRAMATALYRAAALMQNAKVHPPI